MKKNIYIIGAGISGVSLGTEIQKNPVFGDLKAYIDDDKEKIGTKINEIPVLGDIDYVLQNILSPSLNDEIVIAIPSNMERTKSIHLLLQKRGFQNIKIVPQINKLFGITKPIHTQKFKFEDILIRDSIDVNLKDSIGYLKDKRILVTGAGGSIGSEICRQLLNSHAKRVYLLGHGENSIYNIEKELLTLTKEGNIDDVKIVPIIGDVHDSDFMDYIVSKLGADVVFHTAAHKHVPMMEKNPIETMKNNVYATKYLVQSCIKHNVKKFVLISTDKAVNPSSIYGISKNLVEKIVLAYSNQNSNYMVVRFGNVIGSRGSVLPLFQSQIELGQDITITHKDMKRYFITIPEAVSLVLKAGGSDENKKIYLLDMGKPLLIEDIAKQMIAYYGYKVGEDIKIKYIGLREGEKLDEELYDATCEQLKPSKYQKINEIEFKYSISKDNIEKMLERINPICYKTKKLENLYRNTDELYKILGEFYKLS